MAAEQVDHFVRLALPQKPVVDEHAGELIADRLVNQHRRDRGIDAARQAADHAGLADLRADTGDLLFAEPRHRPVALEAGDLEQEIGDEFRAVGGVDHLGMKHRRVIAARLVGGDGVGRILRHRIDAETVGQPGHAVAVAHPHRIAPARPPHAVKERVGLEDLDVGPAEFRRVPALDLAAELLAQGLLAVADGEDRNAALEDLHRRAGTARLRNRRRARLTGSPPSASAARTLRPPWRTGGSRNRRQPRAHAARSAASPASRSRR